jgi:predicted O-methyltransferase YrrM
MKLFQTRSPRRMRRVRRTLVAISLVGLAVALAGLYVAGAVLFALGLLGLMLAETAHLRAVILESERQSHALVQVRPLFGELPLDLTRWSADPITVYNIVRLLTDSRPRLVFECGSGSSTVAVAKCLEDLGEGRLISLDHDPVYADRTRELLRHRGLEARVTIVTAPLVSREVQGRALRWYGDQYVPELTDVIDVLLVDGPPGPSGPRARYPAVPLLKPYLSPRCSILLDDGDRPDERAIAEAWAQELGASLSYLEGGRGNWLLRRPVAL